MIALALGRDERRQWSAAAAGALFAHVAVAAAVLAWTRAPAPPVVEPVVIVELPAEGGATTAPAPQPMEQPAEQPQPIQPQVAAVRPPIEAPRVDAPLPREVVATPPPAAVQQSAAPAAPPQVAAAAPAAPAAPVPARDVVGPGTSPTPGDSAKAKQQGVVVIRFTVDRSGAVSGVSIKRGSGHDLLDTATLDLLRRVAPLPRMPASMQRDSVTLSLPIDYSLRTV